MKKYLQKGIITLSLSTLLSVTGVVGICVATFFNITGNNKERIVILEEAVSTIKKDTSIIKDDIKEILKNQTL